jgi:integrase
MISVGKRYRVGENPARWKGHLDKLLPPPNKVRKVKHHKAVPYAEMPAFFADLSKRTATSAAAMTFLILTNARTGAVTCARLREVDFKSAVWTVPPEPGRKFVDREHRVPLTKEALAVLRGLGLGDDPDALLFPMSENTMNKYLKEDMGWEGRATVHGFRSSFKDWANDQTAFSNEVIEEAMGHVIKNKVEAAYRRGDQRQSCADAQGLKAGSHSLHARS